MNRKQALAQYLEVEVSDVKKSYSDNTFEVGNQEYLIVNDAEATKAAREYILDSLWAFRGSFIADHLKPEFEAYTGAKDIEDYCGLKCEAANDWVKGLIKNKAEFVNDAISADGRGHFLAQYDGIENRFGTWFIYRIN